MKFKILLCACLLAALSTMAVSARTARAIFLGADKDSPKTVFLVTGEGAIQTDLPRRFLSDRVKIPAGELAMALSPERPEPGTPVNPALPVVRIPESCDHCLLLFLSDPANKAFAVRVVVIDASAAKFPVGGSLLVNAMDGTVAAKFGDREVTVGPGEREFVRVATSGSDSYETAVAVRYRNDSDWNLVCRSSWSHYPKARQLILVTPTAGRRFPRVWSVIDQPEE